MSKWLVFKILVVIILFSGCSSRKSLAPVIAHDQPPSTKVTYHVVAPGETLYSIAWRYNLDYKSLAKANKIGRAFKIYPGQRIYLKGQVSAPNVPVIAAKSKPSNRVSKHKSNAQVAKKIVPVRLKNESPLVKKSPKGTARQQKLVWSWPASGGIKSRFNTNNGLNKGVDIGGVLREPVRAASSGTVVYSGEGLRGYGKLIIIKHSEKYLSAYAHNHRLMVKEGDKVVRNEQIAEMGNTGTDKVKLHFEIRYDGKPVDPLAYLPPRK